MRVALIRGSLLRPWELPNYVFDGAETTFFASSRVAAEMAGVHPSIRGLPSVSDVTRRLSPRAAGLVSYAAGSLEYLAGLERALGGFDVAHATELDNPVSLQALRARDRGRVGRVVITAMENIAWHPRENRVARARVERVARGIDHAVAVSEVTRLHLESAGVPPERITVLPVGIDVERFRPADAPRRDGPLRVVSVARLEPAKGVEDLVIAVGLAARRGVPMELTLAGRGPLQARLEGLAAELGIADRVTILSTGWPQVADVYRQHDVFVLASAPTRNWREQFGFAVVEAMATALPVVVGDSGTLPEVVGPAGNLVRPHDPVALSEHLERLGLDPTARAAQGEANRRRALERYDVREVRVALLELYRAVLEAPAVRAA